MTTTITPISENHAAGFREALDVVARERCYLAMLEAPAPDKVAAFVRENVANDIAQFVALVDGRVVGWADIVPARSPVLSHCGTLGMGVLPAFRGKGIGASLLKACIVKSWAKGLERIQLEVRSDNTPAIRLYERNGFIREGVKRRSMKFGSVYFDSIQMALLSNEA